MCPRMPSEKALLPRFTKSLRPFSSISTCSPSSPVTAAFTKSHENIDTQVWHSRHREHSRVYFSGSCTLAAGGSFLLPSIALFFSTTGRRSCKKVSAGSSFCCDVMSFADQIDLCDDARPKVACSGDFPKDAKGDLVPANDANPPPGGLACVSFFKIRVE